MKDQRISFQVAKLAKEKGFDWPVDKMYNKKGNLTGVKLGMHGNPNNYADFYSAPIQTSLQKWIYEKFGYWIEVFMDDDKTFGFLISLITSEGRIDKPIQRGFNTPEDALEEGEKEALKSI